MSFTEKELSIIDKVHTLVKVREKVVKQLISRRARQSLQTTALKKTSEAVNKDVARQQELDVALSRLKLELSTSFNTTGWVHPEPEEKTAKKPTQNLSHYELGRDD